MATSEFLATAKPARRKLNHRQQLFIVEYLKDMNATQAAQRAGYSAKSADAMGGDLLHDPRIARAVRTAQARRLERLELTADDVLRELAYVAMQRASSFVDDAGKLLPLKDLPPGADAAIADMELVTGNLDAGDGKRDRIVKIKKWNKTEALRDLAKHFGLLQDKVEHSGALEIAWRRAED